MPSWSDFEAAAPELAARVRERLDAHTHKTLATIRADGAPRISGTESRFAEGELWIGSMPRARKAHDLQRDPRFALHSGSDEPSDWKGDATKFDLQVTLADGTTMHDTGGAGSWGVLVPDSRQVRTVALIDENGQVWCSVSV